MDEQGETWRWNPHGILFSIYLLIGLFSLLIFGPNLDRLQPAYAVAIAILCCVNSIYLLLRAKDFNAETRQRAIWGHTTYGMLEAFIALGVMYLSTNLSLLLLGILHLGISFQILKNTVELVIVQGFPQYAHGLQTPAPPRSPQITRAIQTGFLSVTFPSSLALVGLAGISIMGGITGENSVLVGGLGLAFISSLYIQQYLFHSWYARAVQQPGINAEELWAASKMAGFILGK